MRANEKPILVLKIGGNQVEDEAFLAGFVTAVKGLLAEHAVIVVHGGGKEITDLHAPARRRDSRRSKGCARPARRACGWWRWCSTASVNTRLVRWLVNGGVDALGLSGVDMGLVRVTPLSVNGQQPGPGGPGAARSTARRCCNCSTWA